MPPAPIVSASALKLDCVSRGLRAYDSQRALLPGVSMPCTVLVGDRSGTAVNGINVTLLSESGRFIGSQPSSGGAISVEHQVALPLPVDVEPVIFAPAIADSTHTGIPVAPEWMHPEDWREDPGTEMTATLREPRRPDPIRFMSDGTRPTNNPRDNLVAWIAAVDGEEAFTDANGNGQFDASEAFVDLTEPFVDADDDGTWGPGELFIDANANGQWDGANGKWDPATKIWAADRVLWTGFPSIEDVLVVVPGISSHRRVVNAPYPVLNFQCPGDPCTQALSTTTPSVSIYLADPWFNAVTHGASDRCTAVDEAALVTLAGERTRSQGAQTEWPAGEQYTFDVLDARISPTPRRFPPASFEARAECRLTNPTDGHWTAVGVSVARGTIE